MSKCRVKGENPKVLKTKTKRDKQITLGYPQVVMQSPGPQSNKREAIR